MTEPVASAMTTFLTTIGDVFTQCMAWVTTVCTKIVETPILLLPFALVIVKKVVGLVKRLILRK